MSAKTSSTLDPTAILCASAHVEIKEQRMERNIFRKIRRCHIYTGFVFLFKTLIDAIHNPVEITFLYTL